MNKLKPGNRVQLKAKALSWHVDHLVDCYEVGQGSRKLLPKNWEEIAVILGSKAKRTKLKGTVTHYGANDTPSRKFVHVDFQWNGLKMDMYCSEADLKRL